MFSYTMSFHVHSSLEGIFSTFQVKRQSPREGVACVGHCIWNQDYWIPELPHSEPFP
jgi:hypothetical protein